MSNGFVRGCTKMQKSALNDHKNSHSYIEASRVVNQSMAIVKHVEKSQAACNEALKTQLKVVLHMENTNTPSHLSKPEQCTHVHPPRQCQSDGGGYSNDHK